MATTTSRTAIRPIDTGWLLSPVHGPVPKDLAGVTVPATVPGTVHTDLLAAGLIPDPYLDSNEAVLGWIGLTDWQYSTQFDWTPDGADRVELAFAGLDTISTIILNGAEVGSTRNMHRSYRFDVTSLLVEGPNRLVVTFSSPVRYADAASLSLGYRPHTNHHPYNAIRKMACSFGWDWGIDTSTSGIWRPVTLESYAVARLASVRPIATPATTGSGGRVDVHVEVARSATSPLVVSASIAGVDTSIELAGGETSGVLTLELADVELWWPTGHGEQPLYDVTVIVTDAAAPISSPPLDQVTKRVGFRTVELDMTPDDRGTPFRIRVNGRAIFIKGANWIPDDAFPHRVDRDRYARRLDQAQFAGMNLIRVWGGGIYESEDFFDLCDERGLLTWQDFLLACAAYAEEEPLYSEFEAEARQAVARIGTHPSLVIFNGNNENVWGYTEWNWPLRLEGKSWGARYYYDLFPSIVAELAPHVPYTPGSPFSPNDPAAPNDPDNGTMHIWDLWNQKDYPHYRDYTPRFVAEFGWQGPPTWATLTSSITDEPLTPESPGMLVHQKASDGNAKLTDGLVRHFPLPNNMEDWHWAMSLNQAVAVRTAVEYFRSLTPHCMGSIVWQLNDCWPVTSWAAVDGYGREKPLLHALRHAHADRLITIQPVGDELDVVLVNDTDVEWSADLSLARGDFDGRRLASDESTQVVPARGAIRVNIPNPVSAPGNADSELIRATFDGEHGDWFFADYRDSALTNPQLSFALEPTSTGYTLTIESQALVRDLTVLVDKVAPDAHIDTALITLLPNESATFTITTSDEITEEALTRPTVVRSANQLIASAAVAIR